VSASVLPAPQAHVGYRWDWTRNDAVASEAMTRKRKVDTACANHPNRQGGWKCAKFSTVYCDECCSCPHPDGYCPFRPQCPIWQICQKEHKESKTEVRTPGGSTEEYAD